MWSSLAYERRGVFLQSLHTMVNLFYIAVLFVLIMISDHPLYLIGAFLIIIPALAEAGALAKGERLLRFGIWATLLIMIINPLVIHAGQTISGPVLSCRCWDGWRSAWKLSATAP